MRDKRDERDEREQKHRERATKTKGATAAAVEAEAGLKIIAR